ncbi:MAG TPA: thioredoxin family protein, partial [Caldimonas sp.]|nr:thioredoxin family protein [Caldimonas sp.]
MMPLPGWIAGLAMVVIGGCLLSHPACAATPAAPAHDDAIAWRHAANDADVEAAFDAARAAHKPVFVYWGAVWCPPCNQVKSTIFNREDFIARSRAFVPVYIDGDSPGAQKLGARFHVSGYPTMLLFRPDGQEVMRLPGEVDARRYAEVLDLGIDAARPVKALLADALAGRRLAPGDWRLLAFYSYDTDEHQLLPAKQVPATLARLADACPTDLPATRIRLRLKALAAAGETHTRLGGARTRAALLSLLGDPAAARQQADLIVNWGPEIVRAASSGEPVPRARLVVATDLALKRLQADASLSRADRMQALASRVELARLDRPDGPAPAMPATLLAEAREASARADREISDGYERQAVITAAAYMLERAGLSRDSDALLEGNLA